MRQNNKKRTALGGRKQSPAVLFLIGLTLLYFIFQGRFLTEEEEAYESSCVVVKESLAGEEEIPLEEYLIGALAVSVPEDFEPEACKAQAVVLRTNAECVALENESRRIPYEALLQESLTVEEIYEKWGSGGEERFQKIKTAVEETRGQICCYQGIPVELPFFPLSAGKTRNSDEIIKDGQFSYLQSVACEEDVFALDYIQEHPVSEKQLNRMLQRIFETNEKISWKEIHYTKDSAGYVTEVAWNEKTVLGEYFRKELGLASAFFSIEEKGQELCIVTKGEGHGLGVSLYTANYMAANGKDYREILRYFFPSCEIIKN